MRILLFELRKSLCKRSILIAVILFSIINIVMIYTSYDIWGRFQGNSSGMAKSAYESLMKKVSGEMTQEKISFVVEEYRRLEKLVNNFTYSKEFDENTYTGYVYGDFSVFKFELFNPMNYTYNYRNYSKDIERKAQKNISFYNARNNCYDAQKNQKISELYSDRNIIEFYDMNGFETLIKYNFSSILIVLLCVLVLTPVFVSEKETNMQLLLLVSKKGREPTIFAKYAVSMVFTILISVSFYLMDFCMFALRYGLQGANTPIYAIASFMKTPFNISVIQFYLLTSLFRIIGIATMSGFFLFFSVLFKRTLFPFIMSISFCAMMIFGVDSAAFKHISLFNPLTLVANEALLGNFDTVDAFGKPIQTYLVVCVMMLVYLICLTLLTMYISRKASLTGNSVRKKVGEIHA